MKFSNEGKAQVMASEATLDALKLRIRELKCRRESTMEWMKSKRKESLAAFHEYRLGKSECFKIGKLISELKDDLRRIKDGK